MGGAFIVYFLKIILKSVTASLSNQVKLFGGGLLQPELLNFTRNRHREGIDEENVSRYLEMGYLRKKP